MRQTLFTSEQQAWLLNVAWKNKTLNQISEELKINSSTIYAFYKKHDIEPMTQRDFITRDVLELIGRGKKFKNISTLAKELNCSGDLLKSILDDIGVSEKEIIQKSKNNNSVISTDNEIKTFEEELINRKKIKKERRAKFTQYTQTGSDILDELRKISTTKRSEKLSNGGSKK